MGQILGLESGGTRGVTPRSPKAVARRTKVEGGRIGGRAVAVGDNKTVIY